MRMSPNFADMAIEQTLIIARAKSGHRTATAKEHILLAEAIAEEGQREKAYVITQRSYHPPKRHRQTQAIETYIM